MPFFQIEFISNMGKWEKKLLKDFAWKKGHIFLWILQVFFLWFDLNLIVKWKWDILVLNSFYDENNESSVSVLSQIFCWHEDKIVHITLQWLESWVYISGVSFCVLLFMCQVCVLSLGHLVSEGDLDCVSLTRGLGQMESFVISSDMSGFRRFRKATIFFCTQ